MFDLYKLSDNEGKGSIKAIFTDELKKDVQEAIKEIKKTIKFKEFCQRIKIKYCTFWDYLNRRLSIPLFFLKELEGLTKRNFQKHIEYLEYGAGSTKRKAKAIKNISEELAKIIGVFAADGYLKQRETHWKNRKTVHYELIFREEYESNMQALADWLNTIFDINVIPKKEKGHYSIYISNKIVFRYFQNIFGFKSGRKTETIFAPELIKNSREAIKRSFILGVLMFDGYVNKNNGYIELYSRSKNLIEDVSEILKYIKLSPDYIKLEPDNFNRYRLIIRRQAKLRKSLCLFEPKTEKWVRLNNCITKFSC